MAPHAPPASPDLALLCSKLAQVCAHICPLAVFHEAKSARSTSTQELWSWDAEGGPPGGGGYGVMGRIEGMGERKGEGE